MFRMRNQTVREWNVFTAALSPAPSHDSLFAVQTLILAMDASMQAA